MNGSSIYSNQSIKRWLEDDDRTWAASIRPVEDGDVRRELIASDRQELATPKLIADITMSLDGFVTDLPLIRARGRRHRQASRLGCPSGRRRHGDPRTDDCGDRRRGDGQRLFDVVDVPDGWSKDMGYGAEQVGDAPVLRRHPLPARARPAASGARPAMHVRTRSGACHRARSPRREDDRHVVIMGGGDVIGQAIEQGLVDELRLHLAPVLLGGTPRSAGNSPAVPPGRRPPVDQRCPSDLRASDGRRTVGRRRLEVGGRVTTPGAHSWSGA